VEQTKKKTIASLGDVDQYIPFVDISIESCSVVVGSIERPYCHAYTSIGKLHKVSKVMRIAKAVKYLPHSCYSTTSTIPFTVTSSPLMFVFIMIV